jgi:peptide deformylase
MALETIRYPNQILKKKAEPISQIGPAVFELIRQMKETMAQEQEGVKGVGLAAPQVGISQRVIVVMMGKENPKGFINPKIMSKSREKEKGREGCLSLPGLWLEIKRSKWAEVQAIDENGQEISFRAEGFPARVLQHEIDHLNGVLFFERLGLLEKLKVKKQLRKPVWT